MGSGPAAPTFLGCSFLRGFTTGMLETRRRSYTDRSGSPTRALFVHNSDVSLVGLSGADGSVGSSSTTARGLRSVPISALLTAGAATLLSDPVCSKTSATNSNSLVIALIALLIWCRIYRAFKDPARNASSSPSFSLPSTARRSIILRHSADRSLDFNVCPYAMLLPSSGQAVATTASARPLLALRFSIRKPDISQASSSLRLSVAIQIKKCMVETWIWSSEGYSISGLPRFRLIHVPV